MLEQVREARLAGLLVLRADVIPDVDGDDRRLVVLVDEQRQPVLERELLVGNVRDGRSLSCQRNPGGKEGEDGDGCDEGGESHRAVSTKSLRKCAVGRSAAPAGGGVTLRPPSPPETACPGTSRCVYDTRVGAYVMQRMSGSRGEHHPVHTPCAHPYRYWWRFPCLRFRRAPAASRPRSEPPRVTAPTGQP